MKPYKSDKQDGFLKANWTYFITYPVFILLKPKVFKSYYLNNWYRLMTFVWLQRGLKGHRVFNNYNS